MFIRRRRGRRKVGGGENIGRTVTQSSLKTKFRLTRAYSPAALRKRSAEVYVVGERYKESQDCLHLKK